jgi:hypothetical protein
LHRHSEDRRIQKSHVRSKVAGHLALDKLRSGTISQRESTYHSKSQVRRAYKTQRKGAKVRTLNLGMLHGRIRRRRQAAAAGRWERGLTCRRHGGCYNPTIQLPDHDKRYATEAQRAVVAAPLPRHERVPSMLTRYQFDASRIRPASDRFLPTRGAGTQIEEGDPPHPLRRTGTGAVDAVHIRERAFAPSAEIHGHDRQALRAAPSSPSRTNLAEHGRTIGGRRRTRQRRRPGSGPADPRRAERGGRERRPGGVRRRERNDYDAAAAVGPRLSSCDESHQQRAGQRGSGREREDALPVAPPAARAERRAPVQTVRLGQCDGPQSGWATAARATGRRSEGPARRRRRRRGRARAAASLHLFSEAPRGPRRDDALQGPGRLLIIYINIYKDREDVIREVHKRI